MQGRSALHLMNKVIDMERKLNCCALPCGIGAQPNVQLIAQSLTEIKADAGCVLGNAPAILAREALFKDTGEITGVNADPVVLHT